MSAAPPNNREAEEAVLGAILLADTILPAVVMDERLAPEHFYFDRHAEVYRAMVHLHDSGASVDVLTVSDLLDQRGQLEEVGGRATVDALAGAAPAAGNAREYARIVADLACWRARGAAAQAMMGAVYARDEDAFALAEASIATADRPEDTTHNAQQLADDAFTYLAEDGPPNAIALPWPQLTESLAGGLRPGDVTLVSGWTNMGKSCACDGILEHAASQGAVAHLYTNEMSKQDWTLRMLASISGVRFQRLLKRELDDVSRTRVLGALQQLSRMPIGITECAGWTAHEIGRHIRRHRWDIAAVDLVNRVPHDGTRELDQASAAFSAAARQAETHLLLACHLNQGRNTAGPPPAPVLRDIRETGSLANDAAAVLFVHRESHELTTIGGDRVGRFEVGPEGRIYFAKVRNGLMDGVDVSLDPCRMRFVEV